MVNQIFINIKEAFLQIFNGQLEQCHHTSLEECSAK